MVSKTRDKLIDVARQLFAYKGVENTTMNDIATASDKGRRTIYTYFKNKKEIYNAVLERQSDTIIKQLKAIVDSPLSPEEKLRDYLAKRIEIKAEHPKQRTDRYRTFFNRDMRRMEKVNRLTITKEKALFTQLLQEGVDKGVFDSEQAKRIPTLMALAFSAIDQCLVSNTFDLYETPIETMSQNIIDFVTTGLKTGNNQ